MQLLHEYARRFAGGVPRYLFSGGLIWSTPPTAPGARCAPAQMSRKLFSRLARKARSLDASHVQWRGGFSRQRTGRSRRLRQLARRRKHERKAAEMTPEARESESPPDDEVWALMTPSLDAAIAPPARAWIVRHRPALF